MRSAQATALARLSGALVCGLVLSLATGGSAWAQTSTTPAPPCTPTTPAGAACAPFLGGALNPGDPAVTDVLPGNPGGAANNYSVAGDGTVWTISFSYSPGDPIHDAGIGFLIYDANWNVVTLQNANGNPPHSRTFPLATTAGMTYQVQVFDYFPLTITYSIGVTRGH